MVDIAFTQTELTVPAGAPVTVNLVNNGAAAHNFTIEELGVSSGDYAAGQTGTVEFTAPAEPGKYEYVCTIPGHREAGMVGTLIVTAGAPPAEGAPPASPAAGASPVASPPAAPPPAADAPPPAGGPVVLDVSMVDIAFEQTELRVPANTEVTIRLVNNGAAAHNFNVDALGVSSGDYAAGQTGELTFNSGAPGEYEYVCTIPGHREAGMVGKLIVE